MRRNPRATRNSGGANSVIPTAGKVFDDGTLIELIEDLSQPSGLALLKWDGRRIVISPQIVYRGRTYAPLPLNPTLRRALRLPSGCCDHVSTAELFRELVVVIGKFSDLAEPLCCQLVAFVFASWLADCLPAPINLSLWSPVAADGARVLRLLDCFCRQAISLSGTSARDLSLLPTELQSTLLMFRPSSGRRLRELLATFGWQGFHSVRSGQLGEIVGSVALSTDAPLKDRGLDPIIEVPVTPIVDKRTQDELARRYLPKLLRYRLLHCEAAKTAAHPETASPGFASQLISGIRACFIDESEISDQQVSLVFEAQRHEDVPCPTDPRMLLAEVLLALCHDPGRTELHVAEIAADMNAAIFSRGGVLKLSARWVGSLLKSIGLATHRIGRTGRGLTLDPATRRTIHRLAGLYNIPTDRCTFPGCAECKHAQRSET
jgi:hypothetical protein